MRLVLATPTSHVRQQFRRIQAAVHTSTSVQKSTPRNCTTKVPLEMAPPAACGFPNRIISGHVPSVRTRGPCQPCRGAAGNGCSTGDGPIVTAPLFRYRAEGLIS